MHTISYLSRIKEGIDENAIGDVFAITQKNNLANNISGTLLFTEGFFFQVLEGPRATLASLFQKIQQDKRHKDILLIKNGAVEKRMFQDYRSGFSILTTKEEINHIKTYLDTIKMSGNRSAQIHTILEPFLL
jgi:hypothetical protein